MYGKTNLYGGVTNENRQMKKYTTKIGNSIWLDISPEAFRRMGFTGIDAPSIQHGDRIITPDGRNAVVCGVSENDDIILSNSISVLWVLIDTNNGVSYYLPSYPWEYHVV